MTAVGGLSRGLTPRQVHTLNTLLAIGEERPFCPPELIDELENRILASTRDAVTAWTERTFYATKSQLLTAKRCEGQVLADARKPREAMKSVTAIGIVSHRAVQLSSTHPGRQVSEYVKQAIIGARSADEQMDEWWAQTTLSEQSDLQAQITSKVVNFLDDWPPLVEAWSPRFEEPMLAKIGGLTLSCRADLVLGRPRADLRQTMLLVDLKSGMVKDEHDDEASFYALVATLRHRVAPWRSTIYSLSSGEYSFPDITPDRLLDTADWVGKAVTESIMSLMEARAPKLTAGEHCRWCPAKAVCLESPLRVPTMDETNEYDLDALL
jgi:hypothetical protein